MNLAEYNEELKATFQQNNTEFDMYIYLSEIIKKYGRLEGLSLRNVSNRQLTERGKIFYGLTSVPDLAILNKRFDNSDNDKGSLINLKDLYGCIEIKIFNNDNKYKPLYSSINKVFQSFYRIEGVSNDKSKNLIQDNVNTEINQLIGEVLWYRKVLYTNGIEWKYLELQCKDEEYLREITKVVETEFKIYEKKSKDEKKVLDKKFVDRLSGYLNWNLSPLTIKEVDLTKNKIEDFDNNCYKHNVHGVERSENQMQLTNKEWECLIDNLGNIEWN
ncbi:hypothetical protein [Vagococcus fluvialis]|uniref:hypothetical protein n=1 Tax=Vagococcus fluvialis TaxID=2738 RepID=UPI001D09EFEA|nr:hypothetical protein [Vagococcus fluvialis]UDM80396.1 hypothetical protein K5K97_03460 [Vagococcus fluvialis]